MVGVRQTAHENDRQHQARSRYPAQSTAVWLHGGRATPSLSVDGHGHRAISRGDGIQPWSGVLRSPGRCLIAGPATGYRLSTQRPTQ